MIHLGNGHTEGDIIAIFPEEKAVVTGDLFGYPGEEKERIRDMGLLKRFEEMEPAQAKAVVQSVENAVRRLEELAEMDFEKAVPGHGKLGDKNGIVHQIEQTRLFIEDMKKILVLK